MTGQNDSQWQTQKLSQTYLDGVRGAIPLAQEQIEVMLKVASAWQPNPEMVLDLGCGDGILRQRPNYLTTGSGGGGQCQQYSIWGIH